MLWLPARRLPLLLLVVLGACGGAEPIDCSDLTVVEPSATPTPSGSQPTARGDRLFGIAQYPSKSGDDASAFALARSAGVNAMVLGWSWPEIESLPGVFDTTELDRTNTMYRTEGFEVVVMVNPIETDWKAVPSDLEAVPFDDPALIARFNTLLDIVFAHLPDLTINALYIGNEVDCYLEDHNEWDAYRTLFEAAAARAKSLRPGIKVGVEETLEGLTTNNVDELKMLNRSNDVIGLTYYPQHPIADHWPIPDLSKIEGDLASLTSLYADKEIHLLEMGYPTSEVLCSSEQEQANFVRETFRVWDQHADQITLISFFLLHDFDPEYIDGLAEELEIDEHPYWSEIREYFITIGLRTFAGQDKLAFPVLLQEASARGWHPNQSQP